MLSVWPISTLACRHSHKVAITLHQIVSAACWERSVFRCNAPFACVQPRFATRRIRHLTHVVRNRQHGNVHLMTALSSCAGHVKHNLANRDWSSDPASSSSGSYYIGLARQKRRFAQGPNDPWCQELVCTGPHASCSSHQPARPSGHHLGIRRLTRDSG